MQTPEEALKQRIRQPGTPARMLRPSPAGAYAIRHVQTTVRATISTQPSA